MEEKKNFKEAQNAGDEVGISDRFQSFGEQTSIHGIRNVTKGNRLKRRMFWVLVLVSSFSILTYQLYTSVNEYLDFDTTTNFKHVYTGSLQFPKITLCNANMFRTSRIIQDFRTLLTYYNEGLWYLKTLFPAVSFIPANIESPLPFGDEFPGGGDVKAFVTRNGHLVDTMVHICTFNGEQCSSDDFVQTMTNYGLCYTFVPPPNKTLIDDIGNSYGLSLILNVETNEYYSAPRENVGFRISVTSENDIPDLQASGIDVSPGVQTQIALQKSKIVNLPQPYGKCIEKGDKQLKYLSQPYTQTKCITECESDFIAQHCSCRMYHSPGDDNVPFCSPKQMIECFHSIHKKFVSTRNQICDCPEECTKEGYRKSMSFSVFPSSGIVDILESTSKSSITASALGYYICLYTTYEIYEKGAEESYNYLANLTSQLLAELQPEQPVSSQLVVWYCSPLVFRLFNLTYTIKYIMASTMIDNMYFGFDDPEYATGFNSSLYFTSKNITKTYYYDLGLFDMQSAIAEIHSCRNVFSTAEYVNNTIYEEFFEQFFEEYYDAEYKNMHSLFTKWLNILIKENNKVKLTTEFIKANYARVDIYFETLKVEELTDQPRYKLFSLICDLGGSIGLFFGASIVAVVEAIDFWFIQGWKKKEK
ncbi:acid-sensing ion channel 2-like [Anneissia japonica]|uniref:acid-sensing ion channel 2-like n=1 Tax=Anneissia japonica TaxID=1529436 RepID=UPI0014259A5D|nr:acid-sensing ion channel 2-like [Anneissia japonica]